MDTNLIGFLIGIISFLVTIAIFFYQENREKKKVTKESQLLTEEIITQIIRNSTQQKISFLAVNIEYLLNGFTKLRNVSLNCNITDLLRMIYLKIYENDFINKSDKLTIMNEIEFKIVELQKKNDSIIFSEKDKYNNSHRMLRLINFLLVLVTVIIIALIISQAFIFKEIKTIKDILNNDFIVFVVIANIILIIIKIIVDYIKEQHSKKISNDYDIEYNHLMNLYDNDNMKNMYDEKCTEDTTKDTLEENCNELNKEKVEEENNETTVITIEEPSDKTINPKVSEKKIEGTPLDKSDKFGWFSKDDSNRVLLGEVVILRMEIESKLNKLAKEHLRDFNDKRVETIYILRKLMSLVEQSQKLDDSQKEKAIEGYSGIRRCYTRLSDILHYNNSYFLPNEKGLQNIKAEIDSNLNLLTQNLSNL